VAAETAAGVVDVLPNPDDSGKDLSVLTIAGSLPQTADPVVGTALLAVGSLHNQNDRLMLYAAGAFARVGTFDRPSSTFEQSRGAGPQEPGPHRRARHPADQEGPPTHPSLKGAKQ
jgi:hypothetical protein